MRQKYRIIAVALAILFLTTTVQVFGQKRSERARKEKKSAPAAGPKRTSRNIPENERVKVITKTQYVRVPAPANMGNLGVVAIQGAQITLTQLENSDQKPVPPIVKKITEADGGLFLSILPGEYQLLIEHPDYVPLSDTISVKAAKSDQYVALNKLQMI